MAQCIGNVKGPPRIIAAALCDRRPVERDELCGYCRPAYRAVPLKYSCAFA
jgi:hypothetical protein